MPVDADVDDALLFVDAAESRGFLCTKHSSPSSIAFQG